MPTAEKVESVEKLTTTMAEAKAIYLADFTGIDVASVSALRDKLREASVEYQVVKNRLAKRAAEAAGIPGLNQYFTGPTAMAFAQEDPVAPVKILQRFIDAGGKLALKTGFLDGQLLSEEQLEVLAKLPSREELLGMVVGRVQGPLSGLAAVLSGLLRNLVGVIAAIEKEQEEGSDEAPASA